MAKDGIARATLELQNEVVTELTKTPGPTKSNPSASASAPGEIPHIRTGTLASSIDHEFDDGGHTGRVGTSLKYGRYLEMGTYKMAPRPYLRTIFDRFVKRAESLMKGSGF